MKACRISLPLAFVTILRVPFSRIISTPIGGCVGQLRSNISFIPAILFCLRNRLSNSANKKSIFCCICPDTFVPSMGCVAEAISISNLLSSLVSRMELSFRRFHPDSGLVVKLPSLSHVVYRTLNIYRPRLMEASSRSFSLSIPMYSAVRPRLMISKSLIAGRLRCTGNC